MSSPTQEKLTLMRYIELLEEDDLVVSRPSASCDQRIEFATDDSRQVRPGTLFVGKGRAFKRAVPCFRQSPMAPWPTFPRSITMLIFPR